MVYLIGILFIMWFGAMMRIEILGPAYGSLSSTGFFLINLPMFVCPLIAMSTATANELVSGPYRVIAAVFVLGATLVGWTGFVSGLFSLKGAVMLSVPLIQFLGIRGALRYYARKHRQLPYETPNATFAGMFDGVRISMRDKIYGLFVYLIAIVPPMFALFFDMKL